MSRKFFYIAIISILFTFILVKPVSALVRVTIPSFPSCAEPQGTKIVTYSEGIHGVPGDYRTHNGSDSVYSLNSDTLTQCLCTVNEEGIQTNWWKTSSLNEDEISYLRGLGWIYIPNGALWGLQETNYMANNTTYSCKDNDPGDDNGGGYTFHSHNKHSDNDNNDNRIGGIGEVLGMATSNIGMGQVLGLASTGNILQVAITFLSGLVLLISGLYIIKKSTLRKSDNK